MQYNEGIVPMFQAQHVRLKNGIDGHVQKWASHPLLYEKESLVKRENKEMHYKIWKVKYKTEIKEIQK